MYDKEIVRINLEKYIEIYQDNNTEKINLFL